MLGLAAAMVQDAPRQRRKWLKLAFITYRRLHLLASTVMHRRHSHTNKRFTALFALNRSTAMCDAWYVQCDSAQVEFHLLDVKTGAIESPWLKPALVLNVPQTVKDKTEAGTPCTPRNNTLLLMHLGCMPLTLLL